MSLFQLYKEPDYPYFLENFPKNTGQGVQREVVEYLDGLVATIGALPVNATTTAGETGFFLALYEGMEQVADWFLRQGADPWLHPNLAAARHRPQGCRLYLSSSPVHYAFKARMSMDFLRRLLAWNPAKSRAHLRDYTNEYIFQPLLDALVFRGHTWFHLTSHEVFERLRLLIEWDSPVSYEVYGFLLSKYYNQNYFTGYYAPQLQHADIVANIALVANQYMKPDLSAVRIQRAWRKWRLMRAARIAQQHVRARIWNPDYIWANGQTTLERIFAGKTYGLVA